MKSTSKKRPLVARKVGPVVRLVTIDFADISRQTGVRRGKVGYSPGLGWCVFRASPEDGPAGACIFEPPPMEPGENNLRIVNGTHWEFSKPNPRGQVKS